MDPCYLGDPVNPVDPYRPEDLSHLEDPDYPYPLGDPGYLVDLVDQLRLENPADQYPLEVPDYLARQRHLVDLARQQHLEDQLPLGLLASPADLEHPESL